MKQSFGMLFSYLFMSSIVVILLSAFGTIIITVRYFVSSIEPEEIKLWKKFATILLISCACSPILLHISRKLEISNKQHHEDAF